MFNRALTSLFGSRNERVLRQLSKTVARINALESEFEKARERGIVSVPTFVIDGRYTIKGAQLTSVFVRILEQVLSTQTSSGDTRGNARPDGVCAT